MPHLVIGDDLALMRIEEAVALFEAGDDPLHGRGEIGQGHRIGAAPRREQRRLVDQVREIGAGKPRGQRGDRFKIDIRGHADLAGMHLQDLHPADLVGTIDQHLPVEAAGAQQRGIEHLGPVGGGEQDHAAARIEAVEFGEQLVQRLLLLVMSAASREGAAGAAERVEFVDKDDARRLLAGLRRTGRAPARRRPRQTSRRIPSR